VKVNISDYGEAQELDIVVLPFHTLL